MLIPNENKLEIWISDSRDAATVKESVFTLLEQLPGTQIYSICGTPAGCNIVGHAPRPVIQHLIESQEAIGIKVVDHLSGTAA